MFRQRYAKLKYLPEDIQGSIGGSLFVLDSHVFVEIKVFSSSLQIEALWRKFSFKLDFTLAFSIITVGIKHVVS